MIKEMLFAVTLILVFSVGVGVLFVRTMAELLEILFGTAHEPSAVPPTLSKRG
ncbi:MAG: hypothetical protein OZSIB_0893 [Candidatus Ozemobacter sibiricus]|jgi:hypothetical protein|uniref:Uncharacterized protein n=1 Tax=Candidatus Ozemobacter sibiricus TaxID=2268124 RepID=A0A367ZVL6_9BACT|nr:MAG: hypothetical protein OZSIB_0893 [Candidatus Ozemobacter sibiricus]